MLAQNVVLNGVIQILMYNNKSADDKRIRLRFNNELIVDTNSSILKLIKNRLLQKRKTFSFDYKLGRED